MRRNKPLKSTKPLQRKTALKAKTDFRSRPWPEPVPGESVAPKPKPSKPRPKRKPPEKHYLAVLNDKLARRICHARGFCEACEYPIYESGKRISCNAHQGLQWCHITSRGEWITRWDQRNCVCMCAAHHEYFGKHPIEFALFCEKRDPGVTEYLIERSNTPVKANKPYFEDEHNRLLDLARLLAIE